MSTENATERPRLYELTAGTPARFADGLGWRSIHALDRTHGATWWRRAVTDGEQRGLLAWNRESRTWGLTDVGRAHVRSVS